jgi:shikimate kinase
MRAIALVGFMGAGKTTVGQALAARLGWRFEDLDDVIQEREGLSIEQIFRDRGEPAFRKLEHTALTHILAADPNQLVLALGGGAFVRIENQKLLREKAIPAVFLDAPVEELFRRCEQPQVQRPLRQDFEQFCDLYMRRRAAYAKAEIHVNTAAREIPAIVDEIMTSLNLGVNA